MSAHSNLEARKSCRGSLPIVVKIRLLFQSFRPLKIVGSLLGRRDSPARYVAERDVTFQRRLGRGRGGHRGLGRNVQAKSHEKLSDSLLVLGQSYLAPVHLFRQDLCGYRKELLSLFGFVAQTLSGYLEGEDIKTKKTRFRAAFGRLQKMS